MKTIFPFIKTVTGPRPSVPSNPDSIELLAGGSQEDRMKTLYSRIINHMAERKPYLDGSFTLDDLARRMYTGRVFVSKTIMRYSGRNFRQFVNWYRIQYAKDLMSSDKRLKMSEVSRMCGFNTQPSFNSAFRLNTDSTPSKWRSSGSRRLSNRRARVLREQSQRA